MRYSFAETLLSIAKKDKHVTLLTGDLGFNLFEPIQAELKDRYINAGVAEHNMITMAAGMAYAGFQPWVYSIAPFVTIKVLEELRNDICLSNRDVKIVGLGGGFDYAIAGPTHHMLNDVALMTSLPHMKVFVPGSSQDIAPMVLRMHEGKGPAYLRLTKAEKLTVSFTNYSACRKVIGGNKLTVIVLGSILNRALPAISGFKRKPDLFLVTEIPFSLPKSLIGSIMRTKKVLVIEEHVDIGGLGHYISSILHAKALKINSFDHLFAKGYISKHNGSRDFYLKENGLDKESITKTVKSLL